MMKKIPLTFLFLSLFLLSCKSTGAVKKVDENVSSLRPVYITNTKKVNLLPPAAADGIFEGLQLLNGSFGNSSFTLMSYSQIDARGISLSLMNDFGTDMGNVFYDGGQVIFDSAYFPKALPGEYIICDIQNAYYDEAALRENYESAGLKFEVWPAAVDNVGVQEIRCIYDGKKLIEEITILENTITIKNYLRGYEYNLTKLEE
jgi:hypothetical protein